MKRLILTFAFVLAMIGTSCAAPVSEARHEIETVETWEDESMAPDDSVTIADLIELLDLNAAIAVPVQNVQIDPTQRIRMRFAIKIGVIALITLFFNKRRRSNK